MPRFQRFLVAIGLLFAGAALAAGDKTGIPIPSYDNAAAIETMPHCTARIDDRSPCAIRFVTGRGRHFYIGSPGSTPEVSRFLATLKEGRVYALPEAFLDFEHRK